MLIAAMNAWPCDFFGAPKRECLCSPGHSQRYRSRISGIFLDRINLHIDVRRISVSELRHRDRPESSAATRERVLRQGNPKFAQTRDLCNKC
jgi:magnesium chelatase family protein